MIITTLMSSGNEPHTPQCPSYSRGLGTQSRSRFNPQCFSPFSCAPQTKCFAVTDENDFGERRHATNQQDKNVCVNLTPTESLRAQDRVTENANSGFLNYAARRTAHLGPLILVKRPPGAAVVQSPASLSEVEKMSYQRELDSLRGQLKKVNDMLEETRYSAEQEFLERLGQFEKCCREEEHRRRQEFQGALANLQLENEKLRGRLRCMEENFDRAAVEERDRLQREWNSRLSEYENRWRELLSHSQQQWEKSLDEQVRQKHEALRQVQELAQAVEELEMTLRRVTQEKSCAGQERDTLRCSQSRAGDTTVRGKDEGMGADDRSALEAEMLKLRQVLKETAGREAALVVQLEACGSESARREVNLERQLQQRCQELEAERRHGADLVRLYSSQVESLHQQLNDAMARNKQLVRELEKFRG